MIFCLDQLLLLLADLLVIASAECKSGIWIMNPDRMNTRLTGYKIRTFDNIPPRICFDKCIRRPRCHSYNYNRHILRCELNYKPKTEHFHNDMGFVYVDVDHYRWDPMYDTCLGNPCKAGEVCETKKDRSVFCVKDQENMQVGDCTELFEYRRKSGIYTIYPSKADEGVKVFCNMTNGGWTVIQRRIDGEENFHRNWVEYENGFGELQYEFWLASTPINIDKLEEELSSHPDKNFALYLCNGLRQGFDCLVQGEISESKECKNDFSARSQVLVVSELITKGKYSGKKRLN
ncbi:uncharacterized protein LOC127706563 [Mytilus californianus]|uniref:uncharacterized protein LOC127706563 n=1 Tax=Mytilus californianus TaxID=6549 RepID=UPI0022471445|nr:uncharacterized protein LOC127706563 [Mytilus californianus]